MLPIEPDAGQIIHALSRGLKCDEDTLQWHEPAFIDVLVATYIAELLHVFSSGGSGGAGMVLRVVQLIVLAHVK